jgi:hypothetical protein
MVKIRTIVHSVLDQPVHRNFDLSKTSLAGHATTRFFA